MNDSTNFEHSLCTYNIQCLYDQKCGLKSSNTTWEKDQLASKVETLKSRCSGFSKHPSTFSTVGFSTYVVVHGNPKVKNGELRIQLVIAFIFVSAKIEKCSFHTLHDQRLNSPFLQTDPYCCRGAAPPAAQYL